MRLTTTTDRREVEPIEADPTGLEEWAESRGFPAEYMAKHGIHVATEDEWLPGWYAIPYPHLSGTWYTTFRNPGVPGKKYMKPPGSEAHLYNPLHLGPQADEVWMAEGELDALTLCYIGVPAVAVPGATNFKRKWVLLYEHATVVVAFDNDEPGQAAATKMADAFRRGYIFRPPEEYNDLNEWLVDVGPDEMKAAIDEWRQQEGIAQ